MSAKHETRLIAHRLGQRMAERRETQQDVSRELDVSQPTVSRILRGQVKSIHRSTLVGIARYLGTDEEELREEPFARESKAKSRKAKSRHNEADEPADVNELFSARLPPGDAVVVPEEETIPEIIVCATAKPACAGASRRMRIRFHHEAPDAGSQPPRPEGWSRLPQRQRIALGLTEYWPHFPADASLWQKCDLLESATGVPAWRWRMLRDRAVDALRKHNDSEPAPQPNLSTKSEKQTVER